MNILMITENDPAGMGIAFKKAIEAHTAHHCRLITTETRYNFDFEKDIHLPGLDNDGFDAIVDLLKEADILHFHILADEHLPLGPLKIKDYMKGKVVLHHHHGHPDFRNHPEKYREKYRRLNRKVLVSTPDLLRLMPEAVWQPNLVPVEAPEYRPRPHEGNGRIRVCHTPTRKDLKNTSEFLTVIQVLQKKHPHLDCVIVEDTPHRECLRIKQDADILFDHMQGYFGVSSLEGLSQGKPVIAGLDTWNLEHIRTFSGCNQVPWVIARNQQELGKRLGGLLDDPATRKDLGSESRHFMETCWNESRVLEHLFRFYKGL
jgi:glycosyltransferase involved in cell wall biosynthesis